MAKATVESIRNKTRGDNPEFAQVDPDFRARLQSVYATAQQGGPESGIAGLEKFEAEARKGVKVEASDPTAPSVRDAVATQAAETTPKGSGAQEGSEEKARKDAAGAQSRVEADEVHSPSFPSAARPLAAEAPGGAANPLPEDVKKTSKRSKAGATKTAAKSTSKKK